MAEESNTFRWIVGSLIALMAASGSLVAILTYINPPKPPDQNPTNNSNYSHPSSPDNSNGNHVAPIPEKVECKVEGAVYDEDNNYSAMPNIRVFLTDDKHPDIPLGRTSPKGVFEKDCSHISEDSFPKKVKVITPSNLTLIDHENPIRHGVTKDLYLYISESKIKNDQNKLATLKVLRKKIDPRSIINLANNQNKQ